MEHLEKEIFGMAGIRFSGRITYQSGDSLSVEYDGKNAVIGYASKAQAARALFLLAICVRNGEKKLSLRQTQRFDTLGVMINASSSVPSVEGTKEYIRHIAAMGMNMLMLYMENTYQMEKYPFFGHMMCSYTQDELREIDDFADSMGVEVIPAIQTLGHLSSYLMWQEADEIKNSPTTLLVGEEKTYDFIEEEIKTMRSCMRTKRIHVGMDEALDLSVFKYMSLHGYENAFDVFNKHIGRVVEICEKYDFQALIWSDMYFSLEGKQRYDYDENVQVAPEVVEKMLDVGMVFWDYYHDYQSFYDVNIEKHQSFGRETYFAGAVWDFDGFAPNFAYSEKTMRPALTACLQKGVKHVFSTTWGNGETCYMDTLMMLPIFSEFCYLGEECTNDDIYKMSEALCGTDRQLIDALSGFYLGLDGWASAARRLPYCDTLIDYTHYEFDYDAAEKKYTDILEVIREQVRENKYNALDLRYYELLAEICLRKSRVLRDLKQRYHAGDRTYLKAMVEQELPELRDIYTDFIQIVCKRWKRYCRIQKLDAVTADLGAAKARVEYAIYAIDEYLSGETEQIEELEIERLKGAKLLYQPTASYTRIR